MGFTFALIACAMAVGAVTLAATAQAGQLVPDPDPNASQIEPQPDPYESGTPPTPAAPSVSQPHPATLQTVHVSKATTEVRSAFTQLHPTLVAAATHVSEAVTEQPTLRSAPSHSERDIVLPAAVRSQPVTSDRPSRRTPPPAGHHRRVVPRPKSAVPKTTISFARSALQVRWRGAFAPSVAVARPREVSAGVALAVAAVVLLSAAFLAIVARQAARQVAR